MRLLLLLLPALLCAACASYSPQISSTAFQSRSLFSTNDNLRVRASVPDAAETRKFFGVDLYKQGIQPVWLQIENNSNEEVYLFSRGVDPEYFSPLEVSQQFHRLFQNHRNRTLDALFFTNQFQAEISAGAVNSGFIFTHLDLGAKPVTVPFLTTNGLKRSLFTIPVPGLMSASFESVFKTNGKALAEKELRIYLASLPATTSSKNHKGAGDPLNIVIIANPRELDAFFWSGWNMTENITAGTALRTAKSLLLRKKYSYSPMSPLYVFNRPQDIALQKARHSVKLRNHLRLWQTGAQFNGKAVWIGQISRDIGVRFTTKTWNLSTHRIDPDVDETRTYLLEDLVLTQGVSRFGFVKYAAASDIQNPQKNLTGDPFFTDGHRAVIELTTEPRDVSEVQFFDWDVPGAKKIGVQK